MGKPYVHPNRNSPTPPKSLLLVTRISLPDRDGPPTHVTKLFDKPLKWLQTQTESFKSETKLTRSFFTRLPQPEAESLPPSKQKPGGESAGAVQEAGLEGVPGKHQPQERLERHLPQHLSWAFRLAPETKERTQKKKKKKKQSGKRSEEKKKKTDKTTKRETHTHTHTQKKRETHNKKTRETSRGRTLMMRDAKQRTPEKKAGKRADKTKGRNNCWQQLEMRWMFLPTAAEKEGCDVYLFSPKDGGVRLFRRGRGNLEPKK